MIIAIDGPAGAGKSTIAKLIARKLKFIYIDTGAMYRAVTFKALENGIDVSDEKALVDIAKNSEITLERNADGSIKVFLDKKDVSLDIRDPRITKFVSDVSKIAGVRHEMVILQRKMGEKQDSVLDGRDIGTVVFPKAEYKFYLDAKLTERAMRRHKELSEAGKNISFVEVEKDLANRDNIDSTRVCSPLKKAENAVCIDTTDLSIEQVVEKVYKVIHRVGDV